jgi:hypothetical protein
VDALLGTLTPIVIRTTYRGRAQHTVYSRQYGVYICCSIIIIIIIIIVVIRVIPGNYPQTLPDPAMSRCWGAPGGGHCSSPAVRTPLFPPHDTVSRDKKRVSSRMQIAFLPENGRSLRFGTLSGTAEPSADCPPERIANGHSYAVQFVLSPRLAVLFFSQPACLVLAMYMNIPYV